MNDFYEDIPFGVIFLKGNLLQVDYVNSKAREILEIDDLTNKEVKKLPFYNYISNYIKKAKIVNKEIYLRNVEICFGQFIDLTIKPEKEYIKLFMTKIYNKCDEKSQNIVYESNKLIMNVLESLPHYVCVTDKNGEIKYINKRNKYFSDCENIFECFKIMKFYDKNKVLVCSNKSPFYQTLKESKKIMNEIFLCETDEKEKYISISTLPIINNGKILGMTCICLNVTKGYLNRLREKEERRKFLSISTELKTKCDIIEILRMREKEHLMHLKDVINNISEGILVMDSNKKVSICNNCMYHIWGLKRIELMDYRNILRKYTITIEEEDKTIEYYYKEYYIKNMPIRNKVLKLMDNDTKKVKYIEFNSNPIISSNGNLIYTIITIKDITNQKSHQIYAEEQAEFVKNVVNTLDLPIAVLDYPDLKYKLLNEKFSEIASKMLHRPFDKEKAIGRNILEGFPNLIDEKLLNDLDQCVKCQKELAMPICKIDNFNGVEKYYKFRIVPYKTKENYTRIYIHGLDITEEINHNMELEKINKMKDEFFTIISHELRTPITIIYSSLQLAYDIYEDELTDNINKTLRRIKQNCSRLLKLTNNIMDISEADAGILTVNNSEFDIVIESEEIVRYCNYYSQKKGIKTIFDTNREECKVCLDLEKYERILLNLISNAIKYTPENRNIYVVLNILKDEFSIHIRDEGVGIPSNKMKTIFNRYSQINQGLSRRAEGTGMGLAIVKKFIEIMGGKIEVKSKNLRGSEFIVILDKISKVKNCENKCVRLNEKFEDIVSIEMSDI